VKYEEKKISPGSAWISPREERFWQKQNGENPGVPFGICTILRCKLEMPQIGHRRCTCPSTLYQCSTRRAYSLRGTLFGPDCRVVQVKARLVTWDGARAQAFAPAQHRPREKRVAGMGMAPVMSRFILTRMTHHVPCSRSLLQQPARPRPCANRKYVVIYQRAENDPRV